jgi:hypothetical protein
MKGASRVSVGADMLVNTLMGYRKSFRASEPIRDLLGAPLMTQFTFDQTTATPRPFEGTTAHMRTALLGALMGCLSKITVRAFIAFQFARDRRAVYTDYARNLRGTLSNFV